MQVALRCGERSVASDLPQDVDGDPGIGHPGQAGVSQVVAAQVLVAERGHDLVPVGGVAEYRGGDPAAAGAGEQSGCRVRVGCGDSVRHEFADFGDEGDGAGALAFGSLVDQAAW